MRDGAVLTRLRKLLFALFLAGSLATGIELLLMGHTEDGWQQAPVVLLAAGILLGIWLFLQRAPPVCQAEARASEERSHPRSGSRMSTAAARAWPALQVVRLFQGLMLLDVASGGAGLWLHFQANVEFARELAPDLTGFALFAKAVTGTAPPSLAPATMAGLGLLGLLWSYRHPALDPTSNLPPEETPR